MSIFGSGANQAPLNAHLGELAYLDRSYLSRTEILSFTPIVTIEMNKAELFFLDATGNFSWDITLPPDNGAMSFIVRNTSASDITATLNTSVYKHIDAIFVVKPSTINVYTIIRANGVYILASASELGI